MFLNDPTLLDIWVAALTHTGAQAAAHFHMGKTRFKKMCKKRGLATWPHRKLCSFGHLLLSPALNLTEKAFIKDLVIRAPSGGLDLDVDNLKRVQDLKLRVYKSTAKNSKICFSF